jgi:hypothetical protein
MSEKSDNESVGSEGTTASQLWDQFQKQLEIKNLENKKDMEDGDREDLKRLKKEMNNIIISNKEIIDKLNGENSNELERVISDLQNMLNNDENIEVTDEEYNQILEEIGISQKEKVEVTSEEVIPTTTPGEVKKGAPGTVEESAPGSTTENKVGLNQPPPPTTVKADVSVDDIGKELKKMNYENINIQMQNDKIEVTAKPPPPAALGGKSKKKQMKPKNKSNKKMKKKQTKKGGKQIKKRSLKRKMKK